MFSYRDYKHFQVHMDALVYHLENSERGSDEEKKLMKEIEDARLAWMKDIYDFLGYKNPEHVVPELEEALEQSFCKMCGKHTDQDDSTVCYAGGDHSSQCDRLCATDPFSSNPCHCTEGEACEWCEKNCTENENYNK